MLTCWCHLAKDCTRRAKVNADYIQKLCISGVGNVKLLTIMHKVGRAERGGGPAHDRTGPCISTQRIPTTHIT